MSKRLRDWLPVLLSGRPHFVIGDPQRPYLLRWYLIPRNKRFNLYLHKFLRDDDDRALHDHPWWFVSLVIRGAYQEMLDGGRSVVRRAGSVGFRAAEHRHRVVLLRVPTWTIVLTGPVARDWGFWCPKGFVPWQRFTATNNPGDVGPGCGE